MRVVIPSSTRSSGFDAALMVWRTPQEVCGVANELVELGVPKKILC